MIRGLGLVGRAQKEMIDLISVDDEEIEYEKEQINIYDGPKTPIALFSCGAAYKQFQIDYTGKIFPCQSLMEEELCLGNVLDIENMNEYIRERKFVETNGYKILEQYFPYNFIKCNTCNKQLFCWSCIETIYRNRERHAGCSQCQVIYDKFFV